MPPRFRNLRRAHITQVLKNPRSKPRHEKVDIELFTKRSESDYVDVKRDRADLISFHDS